MSSVEPIVVTLGEGRRVDASVGRYTVHTDQPVERGGDDSAPSPFQLFLASIGACAGLFVQSFCRQRGIPTQEIRIVEQPRYGADGALESVDLDVQLPKSFPEKYLAAVVRTVEECTVKRAIRAQPAFRVRAVPR
jgi:ribosomal protein S12 methylthiotransferase accessory factor